MNPEQALTVIAELLQQHRPAAPGLYHLSIVNKRFVLDKNTPRYYTDGELTILMSRDINEGPSKAMWTRIHDRFAIFQKRGLI